MRLAVIAIGRRGPPWLQEALGDYLKRFPPELKIGVKELPAPRRGVGPDAARRDEGERLRAAVPKDSLRIALDERGREQDTRGIARQLEHWRRDGRDVTFLIGGADGHDPALLKEADAIWSLSRLTLPHGMAKLVLVEQLYRAWTILSGHPYHRE